MVKETVETVATPAPPKIVGGPPRSEIVPLTYPVEYDGKLWDSIEVRRISSAELAAFSESPEGTPPPNVCAPKEILDALDAEDGFKVEEAAGRFFPRRSLAKTDEEQEQTTKDGGAS